MKSNLKQLYLDPSIDLIKKNSLEKYLYQINQIFEYLNPPKKAKILEIGCGEGLTVAALNLNGFNAYGLEPDEKYIKNAVKILKLNNIKTDKIKKGFSENIPFKTEEFDYVVSFQVLEHVDNVLKTFKETERVLKKGGETLQFCPNYHSFREGHFHIFMLPFMNKKIFYCWLKIINLILGKKIIFSYLKHLNFIKPKELEKYIFPQITKLKLEERGGQVLKERVANNKSIFKKDFLKQKNLNFSYKMIYFLEKLYLGKIIAFLMIKFRIYSHLMIYGKKQF